MRVHYWRRMLCAAAVIALFGASISMVSAQNESLESSPFAPLQEPDRGDSPESALPTPGNPPIQDGPSALGAEGSRGKPDSIDAFQVRMTESDYLTGRLRVLDPYSGELRGVRRTDLLIIQDGDVVSRAQTGVDGVARIKNLPAGDYSVVAIGPDGMAAFGFEVLPAAQGEGEDSYRFDTLLVPGRDVRISQQSICTGDDPLLTPVPSRGPEFMGVPLSPIPASTRHGASRTEVSVDSAPVENGGNVPVKHVSAPLKGQPILVRDGRTGMGQLVVLDAASGEPVGLANARLSFVRSGQILGRVQTDSQGYCGVVGLEDGVYSMVGVGSNGFIMLGVRVQTSSAGSTPATAKSSSSRIARRGEYVSTLPYGRPPVGWRVAGAGLGAIGYAPGFACGGCGQVGCCGGCGLGPAGGACGPLAGGYGFGGCCGFGGGAFGGGGGLGGGGLLGALVGAGLGAAIGAAFASDDDDDGGDNDVPVNPTNPVNPTDPVNPPDQNPPTPNPPTPRPPVSPYLPPR